LGAAGLSEVQIVSIGTGSCGAPPLAMVYLRGTRQLGFVLMEAPPGMTGRFFVAVEPYEPERRALRIWPKEPLRTTSGTSWKRQPGEAGEREERKEATPDEVRQPGSGGVKDNVQDEWAESQERR
jgi:hypothetical protein